MALIIYIVFVSYDYEVFLSPFARRKALTEPDCLQVKNNSESSRFKLLSHGRW